MKNARKSTSGAKAVTAASHAAEPVARRRLVPAKSEIAMRAYELYAHSGHQPGREVEFWLEAERQLQRGLKR